MNPAIQIAGWTLIHFLWQGAAITLGAALVLRTLRHGTAQARYVTACAALACMIGAPLLTARVLSQQRPPAPASELRRAVVRIGTRAPEASPVPVSLGVGDLLRPVERATVIDPAVPIIVVLWLGGVALLLIRLGGGVWRARRLHARARGCPDSPWQAASARVAARLGVSRRVRIVDANIVDTPMVLGWVTPLVVLPAAALAGLTPAQVEAILAHELAHVRRHDSLINLAQALAETLLFYHPGIWWISGRIRAEREHCCDDLAVSVSGDPVGYAAALAELESFRSAPPRVAMAVTGGSLLERVRRLLGPAQADTRTGFNGAAAAALVVLSVAGAGAAQYVSITAPVVIPGAIRLHQHLELHQVRGDLLELGMPALRFETATGSGRVRGRDETKIVRVISALQPGQVPATPLPATTPRFEVASIRRTADPAGGMLFQALPGGRVNIVNYTLREMIRSAYQLQPYQLVGGPEWLSVARFDVVAKAEGHPPPPQLLLMVRSLLADRFGVTLRTESRELPVYELRPVRSGQSLGPMLRPAAVDCAARAAAAQRAGVPGPAGAPDPACGARRGPGSLSGGGAGMDTLARALSFVAGRPVLDKTAMPDRFDYALTFSPDPQGGGDLPDIFTAVREQLGLALEPARAPVDVFVIDAAAPPPEN